MRLPSQKCDQKSELVDGYCSVCGVGKRRRREARIAPDSARTSSSTWMAGDCLSVDGEEEERWEVDGPCREGRRPSVCCLQTSLWFGSGL